MIDDELLPYLPHLLEEKTFFLTDKDLEDLESIIVQLKTKSDDDAEEALYNFYIDHRQIRDALRELSENDREIDNLERSTSQQSSIANLFPRLEEIMEKMKKQRALSNDTEAKKSKS